MVIYKVAIIFIVRYYNIEIFMISQEHDIVPSKSGAGNGSDCGHFMTFPDLTACMSL